MWSFENTFRSSGCSYGASLFALMNGYRGFECCAFCLFRGVKGRGHNFVCVEQLSMLVAWSRWCWFDRPRLDPWLDSARYLCCGRDAGCPGDRTLCEHRDALLEDPGPTGRWNLRQRARRFHRCLSFGGVSDWILRLFGVRGRWRESISAWLR